MAKRMQLWSPDTCKCSVFEEYDDTDPDPDPPKSYLPQAAAQELANRILDAQRQPRRLQPPEILCPAHLALGSTPTMFAALKDENTRKNIAWNLASAMAPRITEGDYAWAFDMDRVLKVLFPVAQLTQAELAAIQDAYDLQFGPLRVKVV